MMNKLVVVFGIIFIISFAVLTIKTVGNQIGNTKDVFEQAAENSNANASLTQNLDDLLSNQTLDINAAISSYSNVNSTESQNTNTVSSTDTQANFCTYQTKSLVDETWFQSFYTLYEQHAPSSNGDITLNQVCVTADRESIAFVEINSAGKEQIGFWHAGDALLSFGATLAYQNTVQTGGDAAYYNLQSWINNAEFIFSTREAVDAKKYHLYNTVHNTDILISTCSVTTTTLTCTQAEHDAWGCTLGEQTVQTSEECSSAE